MSKIMPVSDDIDASLVGRVEFKHSIFESRSEKVPSKTKDGCRFTNPRRPGNDDVGNISVTAEDCESRDGVFVPNYFLDLKISD